MIARRWVALVVTAVVAVAACGANGDAKDSIRVTGSAPEPTDVAPTTTVGSPPVPRQTAPGDDDSLNPTEWDLIGTWTVETVTDDAEGEMAQAIGDACDFTEDQSLSCTGTSGGWSFDGRWLADPLPFLDTDDGRAALLVWVANDDQRGGTARITLDGDHLTVTSGLDRSTWVRTAELPRGAKPDPTPSRLQQAVTGAWVLTERVDQSSTLLEQLPVGSQCDLRSEGSFFCDTGDGSLAGRWWVQRGLGGTAAGGIAPRLALTTEAGYSVTTTFVLDGLDRLELIGTAASTWVRAD